MTLKPKQYGLLVAFVIGAFMIILPEADSYKYQFDPGNIAEMIYRGDDHISPRELAEWIIEDDNGFRIIDIRSEIDFANSKILGAENIPMEYLMKRETIESLDDGQIIVIYSNGNSHAHQIALVLRSVGLDCFVVEGGLNGWNKYLRNSALSDNPTDDEILVFSKQNAIIQHFGTSSMEVNTCESQKIPKKKTRKKGGRKKKKPGGC